MTTRRHPPVAVLALAALIGVLGVVAAPGTAHAEIVGDTDRSEPPDVVPFIDCVSQNADGSWTAVFGYDNRTGSNVTIPIGPANQVTPTPTGRLQPTGFRPGVRHGVFAVTATGETGPMWHLGTSNLQARRTGTACPADTQMPAEGNGTGGVLALGAAGVVGAVLLRRVGRRRGVHPPTARSQEPGRHGQSRARTSSSFS
ncbi:hypothetical protein ACI782_25365 [Geodermatophilus sp. SYSU D00703]